MTRTWWENEAIVRGVRGWLGQTAAELEAVDAARSDGGERSGDPADEFVPDGSTDDGAAPSLEIGLLPLYEAFTALRHELKLQTKGSRNLEQSVQQAVAGLDAASRAFHTVQAQEQQAAQRAARPLVDALAGLDEGLLRAAQTFQAAHRRMSRAAPEQLQAELDREFARQPWWRRWATRRWHARARQVATESLMRTIESEIRSLTEGVALLQTRVDRMLTEQGIQRLDQAGIPVDPHRMTVVELVRDPDLPPETVTEVIRPGYVWQDIAVRFAEVRAVGPAANRGDA